MMLHLKDSKLWKYVAFTGNLAELKKKDTAFDIYIPGHFTYKKLRHARNYGLRKTQANKNKIHLYIGFIYFNRMYNI